MPDETRIDIVAGEDRYGPVGGLSAAEVAVVRFGDPARAFGKPTSMTVTANAYVNHGRWVVDCPFGCRSAQYASRDDQRFWCIECNNGGTAEWATVVWPADPVAVEAALVVRPDRRNANWLPEETVEGLLAENQAAGITPDEGSVVI